MGPKRNITIPDELWSDIKRECGRFEVETGRDLSASEWIRQTCRREIRRLQLGREDPGAPGAGSGN